MCDSGASASIVCKKFCTSISKYRHKHTTWATSGGEFKTWRKARIKFQLPEFSKSKEISWSFHVDESNPNNDTLGYDMIIGRDLMTDLRIIIDFEDGYLIWDGIKCPMKQHQSVGTKEVAYALYQNTNEPKITKSNNDCVSHILDVRYKKADLSSIVCDIKMLNQVEQSKLLRVLENYKDL